MACAKPLAWSEQQRGGCLRVVLGGELDETVTAEFRWRLLEAMALSGTLALVLDLSDVSYINAHNASLIIIACRAAHARGRPIAVEGLRGGPASVFGALGFEPSQQTHATDGSDGPA